MAHVERTARYGLIVSIALPLLAVGSQSGCAGEFWVGAATTSITPDKPVAVQGQFHLRVAHSADNPPSAGYTTRTTSGAGDFNRPGAGVSARRSHT